MLKHLIIPGLAALAAVPGLAQAEFTIHNVSKADWFLRPYTQSATMTAGPSLKELKPLDADLGTPIPARSVRRVSWDAASRPQGVAYYELLDAKGRNPHGLVLRFQWAPISTSVVPCGTGGILEVLRPVEGKGADMGLNLAPAGACLHRNLGIGQSGYDGLREPSPEFDYAKSYFFTGTEDHCAMVMEALRGSEAEEARQDKVGAGTGGQAPGLAGAAGSPMESKNEAAAGTGAGARS
jgi:hypothetical protein